MESNGEKTPGSDPQIAPEKVDKSADLNNLFDSCARIFRLCGMEAAQEQTFELFRSVGGDGGATTTAAVAQRILAAARELRRLIQKDNRTKLETPENESIALTGRLYELAISQSEPNAQKELMQEITFFYLAFGDSENFHKWSEKLFDATGGDASEQRTILFTIGMAQIFIEEPRQAELTFSRLSFIFPDSPESHLGLALTYLKLGKRDEFENAYEQLVMLNPELAAIAYRLSLKDDFTVNDYSLEMERLDSSDL